VISTGGVEVEVELRQWPMPSPRGRQRGIRTRMICLECGASRDALHWVNGAWRCRGAGCGNLAHACRHRQRYCPAIARRERLRRKLIRARPGSLRARMLREQIKRETRAMLVQGTARLETLPELVTPRGEMGSWHSQRLWSGNCVRQRVCMCAAHHTLREKTGVSSFCVRGPIC
jgi:hypothetical protein